MNGDDAASIARIEQKIDSFIKHATARFVSRAEFLEAIAKLDGRVTPLEKITWGVVMLALTGIAAGVLALVIT